MLIVLLMFIFTAFGNANATLITLNEFVVQDDLGTENPNDDLFWYRKLFDFTSRTYQEQLDAISGISTRLTVNGGWKNDWHMADSLEMTALWAYDAHEIMLPFDHDHDRDIAVVEGRYALSPSLFSDTHYIGKIEHPHPASNPHIKYPLETLYVDDSFTSTDLSAWAVATATPVPEPSTLLLIGLGLAGAAFSGRRRIKKPAGYLSSFSGQTN